MILEVLQEYGSERVQKKSGNIMASCPFAAWTHTRGTDTHPSFSISVNSNGPSRWRCFTCNESGNTSVGLVFRVKDKGGPFKRHLIDRIKAHEGEAPSTRMKKLGSWEDQRPQKLVGSSDWKVEGYEAKFDLKDFEHCLKSVPRYAIDRGITVEQAIRWRIGFDKERNRLFFPIFDEGQKLVGWSGRAIYPDQDPKYLHAQYMRRDKYMYGECMVDHGVSRAYLMEGFMDVLNLDRFGAKNCLAVLGVGCSQGHVEKLSRWFKEVVILPHNDWREFSEEQKAEMRAAGKKPAGEDMAEKYGKALRSWGVRVIIAPTVPDKKDPGEWSRSEWEWVMAKIEQWGASDGIV